MYLVRKHQAVSLRGALYYATCGGETDFAFKNRPDFKALLSLAGSVAVGFIHLPIMRSKPKLLDQIQDKGRVKNYSLR
ncbi:protein of unknown function [Methylocaldum szegediense]|uniref:Uncharacterized protein n=1 Tax=Methylocaldum szegediense TaxID=73780 RepID=A0ABM9HWU8_9GAMM|nr:protein of unknown function [Methylocaldum szegediense]